MSNPAKSKPSFSTGSRWRIGFDLVLRTLLVIAVMAMVNFLGTKFFHRYYLSSQTQMSLSSRTLAVLRSVTNHVDVTLYYDRQADFYADIVALLNEYRAANKNITVHQVDYVRDAGNAEQVRNKYKDHFPSEADKDLVIFDCAGRVKVFPGSLLVRRKTVQVTPEDPKQKIEFERRPMAFNGELAFTSILLSLANPQPMKAYYLTGHGEPSLTSDDKVIGYHKFLEVLQQNYIGVTDLTWVGNTGVPADCNLLIIAGPAQAFQEPELQQIEKYLQEGGRLFVLFNYATQGHPTGLEALLQKWGVGVIDDVAQDANNSKSARDIVVSTFNKHPVVDSLAQVQMQLYMPRPILKINPASQSANAPQVDELFATSAEGTLIGNPAAPPHNYPLACAVEQKSIPGVSNPRGNTRIIVVGDDIFLGNYYIDSGGNRDFLNLAVNWLCARDFLVAGIDARPVTDFRFEITKYQERRLRWLLLGALPGGVLFFGWLVWLVRRK